jgi:2-methylcitrate dehydratase PrpD
MGETQKLAEYICKTDFTDIPEKVVAKSKLNFLDFLGVCFAASTEKAVDTMIKSINLIGGTKQSSIIGKNEKTSITHASLANGFMSHFHDFDDLDWKALVHPGGPVFSASLAVAEMTESNGKDFINASILGVEAACRVGYAVFPYHHKAGYHSTGSCGIFGSTAAAAKLMSLNEKQLTYAFGTAGTQSAGIHEVFGTMGKPFHAAKAAMDGVLSAILCKEGFNSTNQILEGEKGFCNVLSQKGYDLSRITSNLGKTFEIMDTVIKRHSSCGETHTSIDAALEIVNKYGVKPDEIEEIEIHVSPTMHGIAHFDKPQVGLEGRFSITFCVVLALIDGYVRGVSQFTDQKVSDPKVVDLLNKTKIYGDLQPKTQDMLEPYRSANVRIKTSRGTFSVNVYPEREPTPEEVKSKFTSLAEIGRVPYNRIEQIIEMVDKLEQLTNIRELALLLKGE